MFGLNTLKSEVGYLTKIINTMHEKVSYTALSNILEPVETKLRIQQEALQNHNKAMRLLLDHLGLEFAIIGAQPEKQILQTKKEK